MTDNNKKKARRNASKKKFQPDYIFIAKTVVSILSPLLGHMLLQHFGHPMPEVVASLTPV